MLGFSFMVVILNSGFLSQSDYPGFWGSFSRWLFWMLGLSLRVVILDAEFLSQGGYSGCWVSLSW